MSPLIRSVWISFRRGGGLAFTTILFVGVFLLFLAVLRAEGHMVVNGRPVSLGDGTLVGYALGFGLRAVSFVLFLFLLFRGTGLVLGDVEEGSAVFDLTAPISRRRYLAARALALVVILALLWAVAVVAFEALLVWRTGAFRVDLLPGALIFLIAYILFAGLLVLLRLLLGGGWGGIAGIVVWMTSAVLSLDVVESYLFDVKAPAEGAAWWMPMLLPYLEGEPVGAAASLTRFASRYFPPFGNVTSLGLDVSLGRPVFPSLDWWSLPVAVVWAAILWAAAVHWFGRRDA